MQAPCLPAGTGGRGSMGAPTTAAACASSRHAAGTARVERSGGAATATTRPMTQTSQTGSGSTSWTASLSPSWCARCATRASPSPPAARPAGWSLAPTLASSAASLTMTWTSSPTTATSAASAGAAGVGWLLWGCCGVCCGVVVRRKRRQQHPSVFSGRLGRTACSILSYPTLPTLPHTHLSPIHQTARPPSRPPAPPPCVCVCRIGGRDNYFHCDTCGSCYSLALKGNHQCVERAMHQNCPICFEFLFESVDPTTVLRCGHTIHTQCVRVSARPPARQLGSRRRVGLCPAGGRGRAGALAKGQRLALRGRQTEAGCIPGCIPCFFCCSAGLKPGFPRPLPPHNHTPHCLAAAGAGAEPQRRLPHLPHLQEEPG